MTCEHQIFFCHHFLCLLLTLFQFLQSLTMNEGRYNLRSSRGECCIPIQLQLASDAEFSTASGDQANPSQSRQVGYTDSSDSSGSDVDISALIDNSHQNLSPVSHGFGPWVQESDQGQASQASGLNHSLTDQSHINSQILAQLSALGTRYMESSMKKSVKTTNDSTIFF